MTENNTDNLLTVDARPIIVSRIPEFKQLSGINYVSARDVEGVKVSLIDSFNGLSKLPMEFVAVPAVPSHGSLVTGVLNQVYQGGNIDRKEINTLMDMLDGTETAKSLLAVLGEYQKMNDEELPNIVSLSIGAVLPTYPNFLKIFDSYPSDNFRGRVGKKIFQALGSPGFRGYLTRQWSKRVTDPLVRNIGETITELRKRGIIFLTAVDNKPNSLDDSKPRLDMPVIFPGVIGVGGVSAYHTDDYERLGYPQLADVNGVSLWESPRKDVYEYLRGNSFAAPMVAIGVGMVLNALPEIKSLDPDKRDKILIDILNDSSPRVPVSEFQVHDNGEIKKANSEARVVNLRVLKNNLLARKKKYLAEITK